jgi:hypothetical protein
MKELVFFLEEDSAKALLENLFPRRVAPTSQFCPRFIVFEGKQDLEKQLERKLRSYLNPQARFIVLRDQDAGDCRRVKKKLSALCSRARRPEAVVRIACRELEAFYLGDLRAVELGLDMRGLAAKQNRAKYRDPDRVHAPSRELAELIGTRRWQARVPSPRTSTWEHHDLGASSIY